MQPISIQLSRGTDTESARKITVSPRAIKFLIGLGALVSIVLLAFFLHYVRLFSNKIYYEHILFENKNLRTKVGIYKKKFEGISRDLIDITNYEKKLKSFSKLDQSVLSKPYENISDELSMKMSAPYLEHKNQDKDFRRHEGMEEFDQHLSSYEYSSKKLKKSLKELLATYKDQKFLFHSLPTLFPTIGWITSFYGPRKSPYSGRYKMHDGIDIGAPYGAPIVAPADGVVVVSGTGAGFGKHVQLHHGYGIETLFAHSQKVVVKRGQKVKRGDIIAYVGSTGHSTGPHLHYEVSINGTPVDPYYFLLEY